MARATLSRVNRNFVQVLLQLRCVLMFSICQLLEPYLATLKSLFDRDRRLFGVFFMDLSIFMPAAPFDPELNSSQRGLMDAWVELVAPLTLALSIISC